MGTDTTSVAEQLGAALGGRVASLRRLSGGASRVTSAFDLETARGRGPGADPAAGEGGGPAPRPDIRMEAGLLRAARRVGVPVPDVVAAGGAAGSRPDGWSSNGSKGRPSPDESCGTGDLPPCGRPWPTRRPGLSPPSTPSIRRRSPGCRPPILSATPLEFLDGLHEVATGPRARGPVAGHDGRPGTRRVVVHGDFRMGNFLVDPTGLRAVLDWELAHLGDPAEDIGWLCARAWRFGGPGRVGGFGDLDGFLAAYAAAGGTDGGCRPDPVVGGVRHRQMGGGLPAAGVDPPEWGHPVRGAGRLGRRVCESEWDLLALMGVAMPAVPGPGSAVSPKRPWIRTAAQVRARSSAGPRWPSWWRRWATIWTRSWPRPRAGARFEARVARNVLTIVGRQLELGPAIQAAARQRLRPSGSAMTRHWPRPSVPVGTTMISRAGRGAGRGDT